MVCIVPLARKRCLDRFVVSRLPSGPFFGDLHVCEISTAFHMKKIVLPLVAAFACVASATAIRAISATPNLLIAALLPVNINTRSLVQTGDRVGVPSQARTLTFAERVSYQRAIEEVYWRHRICQKSVVIPSRHSMP
jgi:hypothetical protein